MGLIFFGNSFSQNSTPVVVGALKDVMWKGELFAKVDLDTFSNKKHLYAMGPLENLKGEILVIDGKSYQSEYINDSVIVTETFQIKAPFLGYAYIEKWKEIKVSTKVINLQNINDFMTKINKTPHKFGLTPNQAFFFKIEAEIDWASYHIMNLPDNTEVNSPEIAHKLGQKHIEIKNKSVELIGFFSTQHQTIFTHKNSYTHIHIITKERDHLGHLDQVNLKKGSVKLFIPSQS